MWLLCKWLGARSETIVVLIVHACTAANSQSRVSRSELQTSIRRSCYGAGDASMIHGEEIFLIIWTAKSLWSKCKVLAFAVMWDWMLLGDGGCIFKDRFKILNKGCGLFSCQLPVVYDSQCSRRDIRLKKSQPLFVSVNREGKSGKLTTQLRRWLRRADVSSVGPRAHLGPPFLKWVQIMCKACKAGFYIARVMFAVLWGFCLFHINHSACPGTLCAQTVTTFIFLPLSLSLH